MLLLLCMVPHLFAGVTGKIAGKVTDAETGDPLIGANVIVEGTNLGGATDTEGDYFVLGVAPGTYELRVTMMGYVSVNKTDVLISADHTTPADFVLQSTVLTGESVTIVAEKDVIAMDMSASQISLDAIDIKEVPTVTTIEEAIALQVGVDFDPSTRAYDEPADITVRGGGRGQNAFMVNGLMMVDNRSNRPMMMVNLGAVQEINIIKGGFNAEYGNVRSGLINVITKEGSQTRYNGSLDFRYTPGYLKPLAVRSPSSAKNWAV